MKNTLKVWNCGNWMEMQIGQEVTIFKIGSGQSAFGERAHLERTTKQHLIFVTESGAQVKTAIDNLHQVVGKAAPQEARSVLPNSLKTELVMTTNLREWRHFFKLRTAEGAHPQMREIAIPLLKEFKQLIPVVFDDIECR